MSALNLAPIKGNMQRPSHPAKVKDDQISAYRFGGIDFLVEYGAEVDDCRFMLDCERPFID